MTFSSSRRQNILIKLAVISLVFCALAFVVAAIANSTPSPDKILADASRYTVKIEVKNKIGLNQDGAGSRSGTGFLIDRKRGWILTNAHVATRSPSSIELAFKNGERINAVREHVDPLIDLAIISIPVEKIPDNALEAELECGATPPAGTSVMAYGHPWNLSYTASQGIVSGLAWFYPNQLVQTDAVINSGNSGGPLINLSNGKVIGINTYTYQPQIDEPTATAVGLAEPMPNICAILELLENKDDARLNQLPIALATLGDDLRPRVAQVFQANVAFQPGDIITRVNDGDTLKILPDLYKELRGLKGDVTISVERDGQIVKVKSPIKVVQDPLQAKAINISGVVVGEPWRLDDFVENPTGDLIIEWLDVEDQSLFTDMQVSDYVVSIDGQKFSDIQKLSRYLTALKIGDEIKVIIRRNSSSGNFYREYEQINLVRGRLESVSSL